MVERLGQTGSLAHEALRAALDAQAKAAAEVRASAQRLESAAASATERAAGPGFAAELKSGVQALQHELAKAESLPSEVVAGRIDDFHEIAVQIKRTDLTFKFAMEIRNKLIDAYREVMRMSV
jgi:flagellar hook-basal body complex protein FliE